MPATDTEKLKKKKETRHTLPIAFKEKLDL